MKHNKDLTRLGKKIISTNLVGKNASLEEGVGEAMRHINIPKFEKVSVLKYSDDYTRELNEVYPFDSLYLFNPMRPILRRDMDFVMDEIIALKKLDNADIQKLSEKSGQIVNNCRSVLEFMNQEIYQGYDPNKKLDTIVSNILSASVVLDCWQPIILGKETYGQEKKEEWHDDYFMIDQFDYKSGKKLYGYKDKEIRDINKEGLVQLTNFEDKKIVLLSQILMEKLSIRTDDYAKYGSLQ